MEIHTNSTKDIYSDMYTSFLVVLHTCGHTKIYFGDYTQEQRSEYENSPCPRCIDNPILDSSSEHSTGSIEYTTHYTDDGITYFTEETSQV